MADRRSLLLTGAHWLRQVWWFVRRPMAIGTAGLVVDDEGRILLVRQSYAKRRWMLPGGGLKRGETLRDGALRELREEAGIIAKAPADVTMLGIYSNFKQGRNDQVAVFVVRDWDQEPSNDLEIANLGFFAPDELPTPVSGSTRRRIDEFLRRRDDQPPLVGCPSMAGNPLVVMQGVNKWFGDLHVLQDVDLTVDRGEVLVVIGPSGSGKSTLCRMINRLEPIDSGTISIDGVPLPEEGRELARARADIGMVFQSFNLFAHKTVLQNVMLGPVKVRRLSKDSGQDTGDGPAGTGRHRRQGRSLPG